MVRFLLIRAMTGPLTLMAAAAITIAGVAVFPNAHAAPGETDRVSLETIMLDGATEASITVRLDSGELWLAGGSMAAGTVVDRAELLRGEFAFQGEQVPAITYELSEDGREGHLVIEPADASSLWSWSSHEQRWHLYVNPTVPTRLQVELGTGVVELVVGGMLLSELEIEAGAGNVTLDLTGDWRRSMEGAIAIGAGDVTIRAPRETGVKITADQGVGVVRSADFAVSDGAYVNAAYGTTTTQIEIQIEQGAGYIDLSEV